jgi:hypothetical protein
MGHQVHSMLGIEEARRFIEDHPDTIYVIIADHRLPEEEEDASEPRRKPWWYQWRFRKQLSESTRD